MEREHPEIYTPQSFYHKPLHVRRLTDKLWRCGNPKCSNLAQLVHYPFCSSECRSRFFEQYRDFIPAVTDLARDILNTVPYAPINEMILTRALKVDLRMIRRLCSQGIIKAQSIEAVANVKKPQWIIVGDEACRVLAKHYLIRPQSDCAELLGFRRSDSLRRFRNGNGFERIEQAGVFEQITTLLGGAFGFWIFELTNGFKQEIDTERAKRSGNRIKLNLPDGSYTSQELAGLFKCARRTLTGYHAIGLERTVSKGCSVYSTEQVRKFIAKVLTNPHGYSPALRIALIRLLEESDQLLEGIDVRSIRFGTAELTHISGIRDETIVRHIKSGLFRAEIIGNQRVVEFDQAKVYFAAIQSKDSYQRFFQQAAQGLSRLEKMLNGSLRKNPLQLAA